MLMCLEVDKSSGLYGGTGFIPGNLIVSVNGCSTKNSTEWLRCLESLRLHGYNSGYIMKSSNVDLMIAQPEFVKQYGDEIQCCEGFSNQTFSSHICFHFLKEPKTMQEGLLLPAPKKPPTTPAPNFRERIFGRNISFMDVSGYNNILVFVFRMTSQTNELSAQPKTNFNLSLNSTKITLLLLAYQPEW